MKEPVTEEENARQATLKILKILDEHHISQNGARVIFDIILDTNDAMEKLI